MTLDDCRNLVYNLLPPGLAWNRDQDSNLYALVESMAVEFCRMDDRIEDFLREIDPVQTEELLIDFESMYGLPDECLAELDQTEEERRNAVLAAIRARGGASIDYFKTLLLTLGFEVEIIDYTVARSGFSRCGDYAYGGEVYARAGRARAGDPIYNSGWQFWFSVIMDDLLVNYARAGEARCGDRLAVFEDGEIFKFARSGVARCGDRLVEFGNAKVECIIRKLKPAHTSVLFSYGNIQEVA